MEIRFNWTANYEQFTGVVSFRMNWPTVDGAIRHDGLQTVRKTTCPRFRSLNRTSKTNKLQMRSSPIAAESTSTALRFGH
ncbi:hypothetical protein T4D_10599 [Trichinella pseudospiralis]|uniref:Uncharacterized protein n=1 Tax=Trichinella pseudospiralis TaxID=6337 RepID=A0A0V1G038_TRIPS|nr:hypothetical protein T4D_10599 [Trichinella pseudospiralis]